VLLSLTNEVKQFAPTCGHVSRVLAVTFLKGTPETLAVQPTSKRCHYPETE